MVMEMKVFNNLTRKKEIFKTLKPGKVLFYSCGPTTYDFLHVGNGFAFVQGDLFHRTLKALGYEVQFARNFTDVDDKIIERANELKEDPLALSSRFVDECRKDMLSLNMLTPNFTPKVSETMPEIIQMIVDLLDKKFAYEVEGEVFYHVPAFKEYGKLSKKDLESLEHGIRVNVDKRKKHPADFVLWKPAKKGEPAWESPWGPGRPGWHIECSAMAKKHLGASIDLHIGGVDLMFPHHENEIAQSEAANGCTFSTHWCHNEFINFGNVKMSKSLGNVITIRGFVEKYGGEILRQLCLSVHYRSKMEWNEENLLKAIGDVERIHQFIIEWNEVKSRGLADATPAKAGELFQYIGEMKKELANDFNAPGALSHLFQMIREVRRDLFGSRRLASDVNETIKMIMDFAEQAMGVVYANPETLLKKLNEARGKIQGAAQLSAEQIEQLIGERKAARASKNWKRSDEIRDELKAKKVILKDSPDGTTTWSYE